MPAPPVPAPDSPVTVLIVNYNSGDWLERCISILQPGQTPELPVWVLDNASSDGSLDGLPESAWLRVERSPGNIGFGPGVNRLAGRVTTPFMLVLNPDCALSRDGLAFLTKRINADDRLGMVSGRVVDETGTEQRGSRRQLPTPSRVLAEFVPRLRRAGQGVDLTLTDPPTSFREVDAVSGACMLIRTAAFRMVDGMNEGYPMHFEDLDLMKRLKAAGWKIGWEPAVRIVHAGGVSSSARPIGVHWSRHRGMWRYLDEHTRLGPWRPLWWLMVHTRACLLLPLVLAAWFGKRLRISR